MTAVSSDGRAVPVAEALGPGGERVATLLARIVAGRGADRVADDLVRETPAGPVDLPIRVVDVDAAVRAAAHVDPAWLTMVEERRSAPRAALVAAGRTIQLEAALNLAMLLGTGPVDDGVDARVASGARLWLFGAGVAWALLDTDDDPFAPWTDLVSTGAWPVGPVDGHLLVVPSGGSG